MFLPEGNSDETLPSTRSILSVLGWIKHDKGSMFIHFSPPSCTAIHTFYLNQPENTAYHQRDFKGPPIMGPTYGKLPILIP